MVPHPKGVLFRTLTLSKLTFPSRVTGGVKTFSTGSKRTCSSEDLDRSHWPRPGQTPVSHSSLPGTLLMPAPVRVSGTVQYSTQPSPSGGAQSSHPCTTPATSCSSIHMCPRLARVTTARTLSHHPHWFSQAGSLLREVSGQWRLLGEAGAKGRYPGWDPPTPASSQAAGHQVWLPLCSHLPNTKGKAEATPQHTAARSSLLDKGPHTWLDIRQRHVSLEYVGPSASPVSAPS